MSNLNHPTMVEIPYADEEESHVMVNENSNFSDNKNSLEKSPNNKKSISERKGANLRLIIDGDDSGNEMEKRDKPGPLISDLSDTHEVAPVMGIRRNSFSMPALNEVDLDALRALHMKATEEDGFEDIEKSKDSLNKITVSRKVFRIIDKIIKKIFMAF